jgi:hypothetical protein
VDKNDDGTGTMNRYRKDSFFWYQSVIQNNGLPGTGNQNQKTGSADPVHIKQ